MRYTSNMSLTDEQVLNLNKRANAIRVSIIEMLAEAKSGHTAGPLGMADVFAALYFHVMNHDPKNPAWQKKRQVSIIKWSHLPSSICHNGSCGIFFCRRIKNIA